MARLVAAQYAAGLFELGLETGQFDAISNCMRSLKSIAGDEEFRLVIGHPQVSEAEKYDILKSCLPQELPWELDGFLRLLIERDRISILPYVTREYLKLVDERENVVRARVISAEKLADTELERIRHMLVDRFKKNIKIEEELDPKVIAGFKVYVGDELIDTSVKKDISDIRNLLLEHAK